MPNADARELFREGRLGDAIEAQTAAVRAAPADVHKRRFLAELLCFAEQWERADQLLDVIATQSAEMVPAVLRFRGLVRGEQTRRQVLSEGRAPQIIGASGASLEPIVAALLSLRENRSEDALREIETAAEAVPPPSGTRNGTQAFDAFRDLDDLCAPLIEFITEAGEYRWVPTGDLALLETLPLTVPRELIWRPCRLEVRGGPAGVVYLPAAYVSDAPAPDDDIRLGRRTDWRPLPGGIVRGVGLRTFLVGDDDVPLHELGRLEFQQDAPR